jgi:hypothetical protein
MKRLLFQACLAIPLVAACSSEQDHPPTLGGGCVSNCGTIGGNNEHDSSTAADSFSDVSFDIGEAGVPLQATTALLSKYPGDPKAGAARTNVTVRTQRASGGTTEIVTDALGKFTLDNIAPSIGIPTWFTLVEGGVVKGFAGVRFPWDTTGAVVLPLFDDTLPVTTAVSGTITAGNATIVLHILDSTAKRVAGVSAAAVGTAVPYYDSGSDSVESTATATGTNGTIVFLGVPPGTATVNLTFMGKPQPSLTVPTGANATSWTQVTIE